MNKLRFGRVAHLLAILPVLLYLAFAPMAFAAPDDYDAETPGTLSNDMLYGTAATVIDADSGEILFEKNATARVYPASTTKIMTLLLAVETGWDFDIKVQIPSEAADIARDSSLIPVYPGETTTFRELLYGMMMHSGNDGANAVAVLVAGTVPAFVDRMNARAQELGCTGTHFANAHGYHQEDHYSTARDLAIITHEAMKHDVVRDIVGVAQTTITVSPRGEIPLYTTNYMLNPSSEFYYDKCIGVKTGSHNAAGKCFVGAAARDGATIITVTMGAATDEEKWEDTKRLFDFGFSCYDVYNVDRMFEMTSDSIVQTRVSNAAKDDPYGGMLKLRLAQLSDPNYVRLIRGNDEALLEAFRADFISRCQVNITDSLAAPVEMGKLVGSFVYTAQDGRVITASLVASRDVAAEPERLHLYDLFPFLEAFANPLVQVLLVIIALLIVVLLVHRSVVRHRKERRRRALYEMRRREYEQRRPSRPSSGKRSAKGKQDPYDDLFDT